MSRMIPKDSLAVLACSCLADQTHFVENTKKDYTKVIQTDERP